MQNKKWNKFDKLTGKCYSNMIGAEMDGSCWQQAFELLKEIVHEERTENPSFAPKLEMIDDATDYEYDIQGWLEDCLDEIDMREEYALLLKMCDDLLTMFTWPEYTGSDIKFRKASVLGELDRKIEAAEFCKEWVQEEPENIVAATASVYAMMRIKEFVAAEELIERFIPDKTECMEENDIMFTAASILYEVTGNKTEKRKVDKALRGYEKYLKECFMSDDFDDDELEDEWLPF